MSSSRMYEKVKTWNPHVGCRFDCVYCRPSFQKQAKRRKQHCQLCYDYMPHSHPERLSRVPSAETVFACAYGDVTWMDRELVGAVLEVIDSHSHKIFLVQSKNPRVFVEWEREFSIPKNVVLGTTVESDVRVYTFSDFDTYDQISSAPSPLDRIEAMKKLNHSRKYVTIEPILDFSSPEQFAELVASVKPEFVYVGYDNHGCRLPEPSLDKTSRLIEELGKFTEVRLKTLRKAWYEDGEDVSRETKKG